MTNTNDINKIYLKDQLSIQKVGMATLLFNDGQIVPKTMYSIIDNFVTVREPVNKSLCLYVYNSNSITYEYVANIVTGKTIISGKDRSGNTLTNLINSNIMVFVDGYKLLPKEYEITDDNTLTIFSHAATKFSTKIVIFTSDELHYCGRADENDFWNEKNRTIDLQGYDPQRYMFFKNGQLMPHDTMTYVEPRLTFNFDIRPGIDVIEYYRLPDDVSCCLFAEEPGYFSYGPVDNYDIKVPVLYDVIAGFNLHIVRLSIDDVRPGFFIHEENGDGCVMIIDDDYETHYVKCVEISPFSREGTFENNEYYLVVPEVKSIAKYAAQFDLSQKLFPEILGVFQKVLLNETYDSIQRLKNIRNINFVDSQNINNLIEFMGIRLNIRNMTLEEKHALLEELTNFYKIVGTETAYNFYNVTSKNSRIINLEQLFTPIVDSSAAKDPVQRYVTFRTAEELGAKYHREYRFPKKDYGDVGTLANAIDSLTNMPRSEGILEDMPRGTVTVGKQTYIVPVVKNERPVMVINEKGESVLEMHPIRTNRYLVRPMVGPNLPTVDYGSVETEKASDFYDYGYVYEEIKGEWVEWFEWDRPTNWYPTNHVNVAVEVPPGVEYDTFMNEFKKTFYDIASTVLYIHNVIDVYTFGADKAWEEGQKPSFGLMTTPTYHSIEYAFTNNPTIKAFIPVPE